MRFTICQLPLEPFQMPVKLQSWKLFLRKPRKVTHVTTNQYIFVIIISKERVIYEQANAFLQGNNLLYDYQSRFRTNHLTSLCLPFLTDKILKGFDEGLLSGMILTDLQKAFDTYNHEILFKKLKAMGFSERCIT